MKIVVFIACLLFLAIRSFAQTDNRQLLDTTKKDIKENVNAKKTNTSNSLLSDFYQLSLNDVTGTSKQVSFGATITAIKSSFSQNTANKTQPTPFENNFQPVINLGYKNNFQNINTSVGFKYAFINQTDVKNSPLFTANKPLLDQYDKLAALDKPVRDYLDTLANRQFNDKGMFKKIDSLRAERKIRLSRNDQAAVSAIDAQVKNYQQLVSAKNLQAGAQLDTLLSKLTKLENDGDPSKIDSALKSVFIAIANSPEQAGRDITALAQQAKQINTLIQATSQKIANGWLVTFNPLLIYQITYGGVQGLDLGLKATKGFNVFSDKNKTSQLLMTAGYNIGADTLVSKINTSRKILTDQFGFNQVLASSIIQSVSKTDRTPWMELGITGSVNHVFDGLKPKEAPWQPALNLKYGILVGKSSWLLIPFTYNFKQKTGQALISIQVNVGDSPFSK